MRTLSILAAASTLAAVLLACEGPDPAETCEAWEDPSTPCGGEEVYQACLQAAEECPGKELLVMESCPVQLACP